MQIYHFLPIIPLRKKKPTSGAADSGAVFPDAGWRWLDLRRKPVPEAARKGGKLPVRERREEMAGAARP